MSYSRDSKRRSTSRGFFRKALDRRQHAGRNMKVEKPCRMCRKERRGAAAVEFALVVPVFLLLLLGMIEMGRAIMVQQVITNASREGARYAVLDGSTDEQVTAKVNEYLASASLPNAAVTYPQGNPQDADYGDPIEVQVAIQFSQVSWLSSPMYLGGRSLQATTTMRRESIE